MNSQFIERLRCPRSGQRLTISTDNLEDNSDCYLCSEDRKHKYPITGGVVRFVTNSNYADNFGMQWNRFSRTQLDSHSGCPVSSKRFWSATNWEAEDLIDKWVLDVGCGSGRFAEVALEAGANVVALDYSSAVDACVQNLGHHQKLHVVQGNIYALPFAHQSFDFVYSLGVLQHTPEVGSAFFALPPMLKSRGKICVDYYEQSFRSYFLPKYWLRPLTKRMHPERLFRIVEMLLPVLLPLSDAVSSIPGIGMKLKRLVPVANYNNELPLSEEQIREWALLDTFDWLSPAYDNPQTYETVKKWMNESGLSQIEVCRAGHLVCRGYKD